MKLVLERGFSVALAARDLDVHENILRKWVREYGSVPAQAFPCQRQLEIERLRKEVASIELSYTMTITAFTPTT